MSTNSGYFLARTFWAQSGQEYGHSAAPCLDFIAKKPHCCEVGWKTTKLTPCHRHWAHFHTICGVRDEKKKKKATEATEMCGGARVVGEKKNVQMWNVEL